MGELNYDMMIFIINKFSKQFLLIISKKIYAVTRQPITVLNFLALFSHENHWTIFSITKMFFRTKAKLTLIPFKHFNQKTAQSTSAPF